jgi:ABC-type transport system involved in multi-copper enzyme maturation permease subunit
MSKQLVSQGDDSTLLPALREADRPASSIIAVALAGLVALARGLRSFLLVLPSLPGSLFRLLRRFWRYNVEAGFVGPLFFFDLVRLARRGHTTVLRCGYALALLGLLCFLMVDAFPQQYREILFGDGLSLTISQWGHFARTCVIAILSVQAAAILLLTPAYLGSAIAEEKEHHTAELLLATRLSDRQFVLGKLFGRLAHLATILLAGLPILTLTRLWGGIDDNHLVAGLAVASFSLLSTGAISILCSVLARRLLGAVLLAYSVVFILNTACMVLPGTSSILFVAAWDRQVDQEWQEWQEQIESTQQFLGKNSPILATVPPPTPPDETAILAERLVPFGLSHLAIFIFCTVTTILIVRTSCLTLGQPLVSGLPDLSDGASGKNSSLESPQTNPSRHSAKLPAIAQGGRNPASGLFGEVKQTGLADERQIRVTTQLLEPIRDPVLLWKEIYQAAFAGPGPSWHDWRTSLWQPSLTMLGTLGAASALLLWTRPELWRSTTASLNIVFKLLTVLVAAITAGLLAFRSGASISGEREVHTLDALLTLPSDRIEILRAKWLGPFMRYRLCFYALAIVWSLGLVTGALHPLAVVLLAILCTAQFAFFISFGLWMSKISRTTLRAHMRLATLFLVFFCGSFLNLLDEPVLERTGDASLASKVMGIGLIPECSWWHISFSWVDASGKLSAIPAHSWHHLMDAGAGTIIFGGAAWLFWRLTRRRWYPQ